MAGLCLPWRFVDRACPPAVVIDCPVAENFEILRRVALLSLRVVEGVKHAHAVHRDLWHTIDHIRLRQACCFEHSGGHIDDMGELVALSALGGDSCRPVNCHADLRAAEVRSHLLRPGKGSIEGDGPSRRHVGIGLWSAPQVQLRQHIRDLFFNTVEVGHLAEHPVPATFGTGSVVTVNKDYERIVELAGAVDSLNDAPDLVVGHFDKPGEDFCLPGEEGLFVLGQAVPIRNCLGLGRKHSALGNESRRKLAGEDLFAHVIPALIELALPARAPLLRNVMRRMGGAGGVVDEERLIGRQRLLVFEPGNGLVGHVLEEMVLGVLRQFDWCHAMIDERRPLVRFATHESVELVKALTGWPAVVRTGDADLPWCGLVPLSEGGGAVAVKTKDLGQRRDGIRNLRRVAGEGCSGLRNAAHVVDVVIPTALECDPCRRTDGCCMEIYKTQPLSCQSIESRRTHRAAERAGPCEAKIVNKNDQYVGCPFRRRHLEERRRRGVAHVEIQSIGNRRRHDRQDRPVDLLGQGRLE